jgi:hypothetical protein
MAIPGYMLKSDGKNVHLVIEYMDGEIRRITLGDDDGWSTSEGNLIIHRSNRSEDHPLINIRDFACVRAHDDNEDTTTDLDDVILDNTDRALDYSDMIQKLTGLLDGQAAQLYTLLHNGKSPPPDWDPKSQKFYRTVVMAMRQCPPDCDHMAETVRPPR